MVNPPPPKQPCVCKPHPESRPLRQRRRGLEGGRNGGGTDARWHLPALRKTEEVEEKRVGKRFTPSPLKLESRQREKEIKTH